jgi:hypothetical protein
MIGCLGKGIWGWIQSGEKFDWRQFAVSVIPAVFLIGATVFTYEPVWSLQTAFYILMAAVGISEVQSMAISSKKLGSKIP